MRIAACLRGTIRCLGKGCMAPSLSMGPLDTKGKKTGNAFASVGVAGGSSTTGLLCLESYHRRHRLEAARSMCFCQKSILEYAGLAAAVQCNGAGTKKKCPVLVSCPSPNPNMWSVHLHQHNSTLAGSGLVPWAAGIMMQKVAFLLMEQCDQPTMNCSDLASPQPAGSVLDLLEESILEPEEPSDETLAESETRNIGCTT
ncbi:hypothetical protein WISP_132580 [Willisornis vidua]|uniref:Uncharacterized protein n=1 Tax=Willisornis vidua TaxID=1566151 RepID=A0ABQ9CP32_9PASS|nr:hypothetical protein WISP_132580 [Willisornis vidua]